VRLSNFAQYLSNFAQQRRLRRTFHLGQKRLTWEYGGALRVDGATRSRSIRMLLAIARRSVLTAVLAGFGRTGRVRALVTSDPSASSKTVRRSNARVPSLIGTPSAINCRRRSSHAETTEFERSFLR
jgi:hypothetical protein